MKVNELRIGNFLGIISCIDDNLHTHQVWHIKENDELINGIELTNFRPINIKEEWLIKLGFEKQKGIYRSFYQSNDNNYLSICFDNDRYYFMDVNEDPSFSGFNYVHQLQNLYFALTNEELTIKTK